MEKTNENHHLVALSGRKQNLLLYHYKKGAVSLKEWGTEIFNRLDFMAALLDHGDKGNRYRECIASEFRKLQDPSLLPSDRVWKETKTGRESFLEFGVRKALEFSNQKSEMEVLKNVEGI